MKILIVGSFRWEMYAKAFQSGFKELGHEVRCIDTNQYRYRRDLPFELLNKIQYRYYIGIPLNHLNKDIIKECTVFKPDFVFFYYCMTIYSSTLRKIQSLGIKFFTYCNDDPYGKVLTRPCCYRFHKSIRMADWNFVYRQKNVVDYKKDGINNVSVLLPYFIKKNNLPLGIERDIPIAFIGHWENDGRDDLIVSLLNDNVPVRIYGDISTWKQSAYFKQIMARNAFHRGEDGTGYNKLINRCMVTIVFLSKKNSDTYTRRCFEIPATRTCMLCEYTDDMNRMFPEDESAIYFRSKDEFLTKAKQLIANSEKCAMIGENAYKRLQIIGGNEVDRCREIIQIYEKL